MHASVMMDAIATWSCCSCHHREMTVCPEPLCSLTANQVKVFEMPRAPERVRLLQVGIEEGSQGHFALSRQRALPRWTPRQDEVCHGFTTEIRLRPPLSLLGYRLGVWS